MIHETIDAGSGFEVEAAGVASGHFVPLRGAAFDSGHDEVFGSGLHAVGEAHGEDHVEARAQLPVLPESSPAAGHRQGPHRRTHEGMSSFYRSGDAHLISR